MEEDRLGSILKGTVKKFFSLKGYGFVIGEDGKEYFFHVDNRATPHLSHAGIFLLKPGTGSFSLRASNRIGADPVEGSRIAFELARGSKGIRAGNWCYIDPYEAREREVLASKRFRIVFGERIEEMSEGELKECYGRFIEKRLKSLIETITMKFERMTPLGSWIPWEPPSEVFTMRYRIVQTTEFENQKKPIVQIVWSGAENAVEKLEREHPLSWSRERRTEGSFIDSESRGFRTKYKFQKLDFLGNWIRWSDPRPYPFQEFTARQIRSGFPNNPVPESFFRVFNRPRSKD